MKNYTIDTLEKLCHFEATAEKGFDLLYKLAISDNQLQGDAEIAFIELFQVALAETVISLDKRLEIIRDIEDESGISDILIKVYGRMLKSSAFIGHMRPSNETFKRSYYYPNNSDEISNYYKCAISKLGEIALADDASLAEDAKNALVSRLTDQLYYGEPELVINAISEIITKTEKLDTPLRNKLVELSLNTRDLTQEIIELINQILEENKPKTTEEELRSMVTEAPWVSQYVDAEERINVSSKKAMDLAQHYIDSNTNWIEYINLLLQGEQRQTFYFAKVIGQSDFDKNAIIDKIIEAYKNISLDQQNAVFLNGFIEGVNDDKFARETILKLISYPETENHGIRQIRFLKNVLLSDLNLVKYLLEKNNNYLRNLEYIDLINLTNDQLIELTSWIKDINYSFALQIFHDILRKEDRWETLKEVVNGYLYVDDILKCKSFINNSIHIEDLLKKSLQDNPIEEKFEFLIDKIINGYDDFSMNDDSLLDRLTYFLLEDYWDQSWKYFGAYLANETVRNYSLKMFLERYKFDNKKLDDWAQLNTEKYPAVAFQFMNIYVSTDDDELSWDPIAIEIINVFGKQKKVLENLSSKLSNYTIYTYSAESLYQKRKRFIEQLIDHPFEEVKTFVKNEIEYLDLRIKQERVSGENYELGR